MARLFEFIASGTVLYLIMGVGIVLLAWVWWQWPLVVTVLLWPFRKLRDKIAASKLGLWVMGTVWWKWLEAKELDPAPHPLSWWVTRGAVVLAFWVGISAAVFERGRVEGRLEQAPMAFLAAPDTSIIKRVSASWESRARACETQKEFNLPPALPDVESVKVPEAPPVAPAPAPASHLEPGSPVIKALDAPKAYRKVCKPDWLCKVDKAVGLQK